MAFERLAQAAKQLTETGSPSWARNLTEEARQKIQELGGPSNHAIAAYVAYPGSQDLFVCPWTTEGEQAAHEGKLVPFAPEE